MTVTRRHAGCKDTGASFFLLGLGSLRLQQNFLEAYLSWFGEMPSWRHFLGLAADGLCSDLPVLAWNDITSVIKSRFSEHSDLHTVGT